MFQLAGQHLVSSIEPRGYGAHRKTKSVCNLIIGHAFDVFEQNGHPKFWRQLADRTANRFGYFPPVYSFNLRAANSDVFYVNLRIKRHESPPFAMLVRARVGYDSIEPGRELRVLSKLIDRGEQFQEDLLR